ncbi:hypothetical protein [Hasllibacter sp. MH4015]|uniref:hypothetical protein n=1 Tax=Hasllibacter sp. MH4015 TaxID=2854029 RepID=UPI001CD25C0D|nr:hypothetical protein [Hasllibacter sp. MH4015]
MQARIGTLLFAVFALCFATQVQAQFLDENSPECIQASTATGSETDEIDLLLQTSRIGTGNVHWGTWGNRIDFCLAANFLDPRMDGSAILSEWFGGSVIPTIQASGIFASIGPVQQAAATVEQRLQRRCGDNRACRAQRARQIASDLFRDGPIRAMRFWNDDASVVLIFINGELTGGFQQRLRNEEVTAISEVQFAGL